MAGPTISPFGDVTSSALDALSDYPDAASGIYGDFSLVEGQIEKIYTVNDPRNDEANKPGYATVYDVLARTPDGGTGVLRRCRAAQPLFGGAINNFFEVIPTDPGPSAKLPINSSLKPGTKVLVGFLSGQRSSPVIIGALPHENPVAKKSRPTSSLGTHLEGEFQGLNWKITKDGDLKIKFNSPKNQLGIQNNASLKPTEIVINKNGFNLKTHETDSAKAHEIDMDSTAAKITIRAGKDITMELDANNGKVKLTCKELEQISTEKDVKITAKKKVNIKADDEIIVNSAKMIKLQKGDGAPTEPFVLGEEFVKFMTALLQKLISHQHIGNLGAPTPIFPASLSDFQALLNSPIGDKKILSKHIKGVK